MVHHLENRSNNHGYDREKNKIKKQPIGKQKALANGTEIIGQSKEDITE